MHFYGKSCGKFSKYASHLQEMLWEMLWEMLQEILWEILWEMTGGMMQFFHLTHGWARYNCLQTIHEPACVILTLFQFFYLVPNSKNQCTVVSCIWQRNYLFSFFNAEKGVSFSQSFRNTRMPILRILYVYENLECTRKLDDFSSSQLTISYHVFYEQLILWIVGIIVIHYYFLI